MGSPSWTRNTTCIEKGNAKAWSGGLGEPCPDTLFVKSPRPRNRQQHQFGLELCLWQHGQGSIFLFEFPRCEVADDCEWVPGVPNTLWTLHGLTCALAKSLVLRCGREEVRTTHRFTQEQCFSQILFVQEKHCNGGRPWSATVGILQFWFVGQTNYARSRSPRSS